MIKIYYFYFLAFFFTSALCAQNIMPNFNLNRLGGLTYTDNLSGVWGYEKNGHKYAIVGTTQGYSIVDIENPSQCQELNFTSKNANSAWAEVQVYGDYVYGVADATSSGIYIADLSDIENGNIIDTFVFPKVVYNNDTLIVNKGHTLFIDENGILYINGTNILGGATLIFDISQPTAPLYLGSTPATTYVHDCYVRGDTLWTANIYEGNFKVYDIRNKSNPIYLAAQSTPSIYTHNMGISANGQYLFTTDERDISWMTAYDVSDLDNIIELDKYRSRGEMYTPVVPHNVYIKDDYAILAHYTDGLVILDVSRPHNIVEVGYYSTYAGQELLFNGAWGAYPYYSDNTIIVGDIQTGLHVFQPNYQRAAWLEGIVYDSLTGAPIHDATIMFTDEVRLRDKTKLDGTYAMGKGKPGTYYFYIIKNGYFPKTIEVNLENGVLTTLDIALKPWGIGIDELAAPTFNIYPNPSQDIFILEKGDMALDKNIKIDIYNTLGQLVQSEIFPAQATTLSIGESLMTSGVYMLCPEQQPCQKIIKH